MSDRRLAAILIADAAGFSARAARDERAALAELGACMEILQRTMGLKFNELDAYLGARATRGHLLPRGWQKVEGLSVE